MPTEAEPGTVAGWCAWRRCIRRYHAHSAWARVTRCTPGRP